MYSSRMLKECFGTVYRSSCVVGGGKKLLLGRSDFEDSCLLGSKRAPPVCRRVSAACRWSSSKPSRSSFCRVLPRTLRAACCGGRAGAGLGRRFFGFVTLCEAMPQNRFTETDSTAQASAYFHGPWSRNVRMLGYKYGCLYCSGECCRTPAWNWESL